MAKNPAFNERRRQRKREKQRRKRIESFWKDRTSHGTEKSRGFQLATLESQPVKNSSLEKFHETLQGKKPISGGLPESGKRR